MTNFSKMDFIKHDLVRMAQAIEARRKRYQGYDTQGNLVASLRGRQRLWTMWINLLIGLI